MKTIIKKISVHLIFLALALMISTLIFIFLPFSYYAFQSSVHDILANRKIKRVDLDSLAIVKPEKKKEKQSAQKTEKKEFKMKSYTQLLKLDLNVLGSDPGEGIVAGDSTKVINDYEADEPPIKKFITSPKYPLKAREEGVECTVKIKIKIDEQGIVRKIIFEDVKPHWGFEDAVYEAVMQWRFKPAEKNKMPISVWARQEINFRL